MNRFRSYELRTTDLEAARGFYADVFGPDFFTGSVTLAPLPPAARARGPVPHWLGHIRVDDVPGTTQRFIAHGATPLGPTTAVVAALRDPSGAVLALSASADSADTNRVAWHVLHATDAGAAAAMYSDVFGWAPCDDADTHSPGKLAAFAWTSNTQPAGVITSSAQLPGVHPHWLFFFPTQHLDDALAVVRDRGGRALPVVSAYGQRLAACEDAQGGAFGLSQQDRGVACSG